MSHTNWRLQALCATRYFRSVDFFPNTKNLTGIAKAKAVCHSCPVRQACLADALRVEGGQQAATRHGIRGGLTGKQRRKAYENAIRARRRRARQAAAR